MRRWLLFEAVLVMLLTTAGGGSAMAQTSRIDGVWLGTLTVGQSSIRAQVHLQKGGTVCVFDSVDQKAFGIPCGNVKIDGSSVSFDVPAVNGKWKGTLSGDGKTLSGNWTQGPGTLPLVMTRQATAIEGPKIKPPSFDEALPPAAIGEIKAILDKDLATVTTKGQLAPGTGEGVTIGVIQHGARRIWSYGVAKDDSIYEIGSISKTFTATILASMVEQKKVTLDEPVRNLLPAGTVAKPATGDEITLLDLSDQHSGLPRLPENLKPKDPSNPYADYDSKALYEYIGQHGVALPANAPFVYSNLGVGLLGQALADRAGTPYAALLQREVTSPLGMKSTGIDITPAMKARFISGHDGGGKPAQPWDLGSLQGAGGIRSDAADMLTYLEAQLHPEKLADKTLASAIPLTHVIHKDVGGGMHIGLNWFQIDATGSFWHNGGTGGYSAYALFNPSADYALVVLFNRTVGEGSITDVLGEHIEQRLRGVKALSLE
jgi:CubicO group peptidase (beta-lactamase class C family)